MKKLLILIFVSLLLATSNPINLSAIDNVCSIDGLVNCSSLAEAITAVDSETDRVDRTVTIYMNSDHDLCSPETLTIPENCTIEIDLNGKTISNTLLDSNTPMITNNGVLTIIDKTGTGQIIINNTNHSNTIIQNNNIFDLDNGHLINNSEKTNSSAIINGADGLNRNSETYINGGFVSAPNGISIEQHGYSSTYNSLIKVNGGTFTAGLNTIKTTENINSYSTPLLIEGGEFNKNFDVDSTHCVRNATFANEIDAVLIADQFHQETISPDNHRITTQYDVKIGSTYYNTLQDAISNVSSNQTIELIKDAIYTNYKPTIPPHAKLDLQGHELTTADMYLYGSIFDSSEIINSDLCYYCRPQGKLVLLSDDKLLRNLNSTYIRLNTTNPQYPLPVFNSVDNSYKFYTITSSEVQKLVETNTGMIIKAKLKVRQLVGFKPNSVWKEIINNDTNIRTGLMFYLANNVTSGDNGSTSFYNSELSRFKYYMLSREKANQWAAVNGYGTAIYNLNIELSSQTNDTFSISPCIIDEKNKIVYQTSNEITQSGFINEGV